MRTLQGKLNEKLKNPEFKKEYDALDGEYDFIRQIIKARIDAGLTQKELAERIGTRQGNISRIENGNYNPSIAFLRRIADATGTKLQVALK